MSKAAPHSENLTEHDQHYGELLNSVDAIFASAVGLETRLFTTDSTGLFARYLDGLPSERQVHTCHACRTFMKRYGGLVAINASGVPHSVFWHPSSVPSFYHTSILALQHAVETAKVSGVFINDEQVWGTPITGQWTHFAVVPPKALRFKHRILNAGQVMAEKREQHRMVSQALTEYTPELLRQALRLLEGEALNRPEKFTGPLRWLLDLRETRDGLVSHHAKTNLVWRAVASAPEGFTHPRGSVIGDLLDNIANGLPLDQIRAKFKGMVDPRRYQRAQVPPTAGNVSQAEKVVEALGVRKSLDRRYADLDEIEHVLWRPRPARGSQDAPDAPSSADGVFAHLTTHAPRRRAGQARAQRLPVPDIPDVTITWASFYARVLPAAEAIDFYVPRGFDRYLGFTTALHQDAPPIFKWDTPEHRIPVSWYCYPEGSPPHQWGLVPLTWHRVAAIASLPTEWCDPPMLHLGEGVVLILEGAIDQRDDAGNGLFVEMLKQEFFPIRATIEAFAQAAKIGGRDISEPACGYDIRKGSSIHCRVRVTTRGLQTVYVIDRWD